MYYPIGWQKVLKLDTECSRGICSILSIQANQERELFFILTTKSIHIWHSRPPVEIAAHKRSSESLESIGCNKTAAWKSDSSVIIVATEKDQLLFYQIRRRFSPSSPAALFQGYDGDGIYRLRNDMKDLKKILRLDSVPKDFIARRTSNDYIPSLSIFSFGKLDLSSIGVTCILPAEEELVIGAKNGEIYGVHWTGNVDDKFPWSLSKHVEKGSDFVIDLKFSSILSGFSFVFQSGRVAFMPTRLASSTIDLESLRNSNNNSNNNNNNSKIESVLNYLPGVDEAVCTEINHRYRLVAYGLKNSKIIVCNVGDPNSSLIVNHILELKQDNFPHDTSRLGAINCMRYSPDSVVLAASWDNGDLAIWSVFGSLIFFTRQWQLESHTLMSPIHPCIKSFAWGREGYNIWMNLTSDETSDQSEKSQTSDITCDESDQDKQELDSIDKDSNGSTSKSINQVSIMSIAHSNLASSPQLTCCTDSIVILSEDRLYIGPSIPHKAEFDQWFQIDIPRGYLTEQYPIKYATVDRDCKNLAIAGATGFALYSITTGEWRYFAKKHQEANFVVCGDIIWWNEFLILSCYNLENEVFEVRAYMNRDTIENGNCTIEQTKMEIIRMSIFENRLLVLYSDGTLAMFMLNLRARHPVKNKPGGAALKRSDSIVSASAVLNGGPNSSLGLSRGRSDSTMSSHYPMPKNQSAQIRNVTVQIAPMENLMISNLQANPHCISAIALTRLHFKNNRMDDSILLNACGKLFLLERETSSNLSSPTPSSEQTTSEINDLSIDSQKSSDIDMKVQSAKRLSTSKHFASASLRNYITELSASSNVTFKAVSVIATNVEQFWISPEISRASDMSYFKKSLWLYCGGSKNSLLIWLPLLNDPNDMPTDLYVPDRIMLPVRCDIYPLAIRSSAQDTDEPDDAIVLGAESEVLFRDNEMFACFPFSTVRRQCRVYLHRILRELLLNQHLGYYARKIAESCQSLPYFGHCFELLLHEVLEEEATSPVPLPDPMLPQVVRFIKEFPVYLETVVHCARKSELSMWSHLFDERAVGNPTRLFQECLDKNKLDTAASCLIILQSLDRNIITQQMVKKLIKAAQQDPKFHHLIEDLENFLSRAELEYQTATTTTGE